MGNPYIIVGIIVALCVGAYSVFRTGRGLTIRQKQKQNHHVAQFIWMSVAIGGLLVWDYTKFKMRFNDLLVVVAITFVVAFVMHAITMAVHSKVKKVKAPDGTVVRKGWGDHRSKKDQIEVEIKDIERFPPGHPVPPKYPY